MPRAPHRPSEHTRCGRVVENLFGVGVKSNLSANSHGNLSQVTGRWRTVGDLAGGQCCLAGLDTVEEISPMAG